MDGRVHNSLLRSRGKLVFRVRSAAGTKTYELTRHGTTATGYWHFGPKYTDAPKPERGTCELELQRLL